MSLEDCRRRWEELLDQKQFLTDGINTLPRQNGEMPIRKAPIIEQYKYLDSKLRKCFVGPKVVSTPSEEKTILVIGQTGSGKTTLIDGIFNYITAVQWNDPYRRKLTDLMVEEKQKQGDETISHTEWITVYSIPYIEGSDIPFKVNIIDTPGFGDTRGINYDKKFVSNLNYFFNNDQSKHGITSIDAICFVVRGPDARLSDSQEYIYNGIMAIFGKDIAENFVALATFADGKVPKVYKALEKAKVPMKACFKFNNSALFSGNCEGVFGSNAEDIDLDFDKKCWQISKNNYEKLFQHLLKAQGKSVFLTSQVLQERQQLQAILKDIRTQIQKGLHEMERLQNENLFLKQHQQDMGKYSVTTTEEDAPIEAKNPDGVNTLYCMDCKRECHYPCVKFQIFKWFCPMFNFSGECKVCKEAGSSCKTGCHNFIDNHFVSVSHREVKIPIAEFKERYRSSVSHATETVDLMDKITVNYKNIKDNVQDLIGKAKLCYDKINDIALCQDPLTKAQFIGRLIEYEEQQSTPGHMSRKKMLLDLLEDAKNLDKATQNVNPLESVFGKQDLQNYVKVSKVYKQ